MEDINEKIENVVENVNEVKEIANEMIDNAQIEVDASGGTTSIVSAVIKTGILVLSFLGIWKLVGLIRNAFRKIKTRVAVRRAEKHTEKYITVDDLTKNGDELVHQEEVPEPTKK